MLDGEYYSEIEEAQAHGARVEVNLENGEWVARTAGRLDAESGS